MKKILSHLLLFLSLAVSAQNSISSGEYWFDSDIDLRQEIVVSPQSTVTYSASIDISSLDDGLHTYHLRFTDDSLRWSSTVSHFFLKYSTEGNPSVINITGYKYWFDNEQDEAIMVDIPDSPSFTFDKSLDIGSLNEGLHTIHCRFLDTKGYWSSAVSRFFIIPSEGQDTTDKVITSVEYWFDSSIGDKITKLVGPATAIEYLEAIDVSNLKDGLHTITFRLKDKSMTASSSVTKFFLKIPEEPANGENIITAYRYWLNDSTIYTREISDQAPVIVLLDTIDMKLLAEGDYIVNMQFKDSMGLWSGTISDTIQKNIFPYAVLSSDSDISCLMDSILFSAIMVDADSIAWDFDNGSTTDNSTIKYAYHTAGEYLVSALVYNTTENMSAGYSLEGNIQIKALPAVEIGDSLSLSINESAELNAGEGFMSYLWNDISGTNLYTVDGSELGVGQHFVNVVVENEFGCINSDTIIINIDLASAIGDLQTTSFRIYPNPVTDILHIDQEENKSFFSFVSIVNSRGQVFISRKKISSTANIDLSNLSAGYYYLILEAGGKKKSVPIIKL